MAAFTSKATGNWSSAGQTTWNEVGVPGNGDTIIVGTSHNVTVDADEIIGTSPAAGAGTAAILVNTTGTLTLAAGKKLTCRGDLKLNNTTFTMGAGSIFEFDASLAGVPSTALYVCQIGTNATDASAKFIVNGTSGSRCTIRSVNTNGGGNGRFTSNGNDQSGQVNATFVDLLRIGDATHTAFEFWLRSGQEFKLQNAILDACGQLVPDANAGLDSDCQITFNHVTMKNTVGSNSGSTNCTSSAKTGGGIRQMTFCSWDLGFLFHAATDWTIDDNIFQGTPDWTTGTAASFNRNMYLIPQANGGDWLTFGPITDMYALRIGDPNNQHTITTTASSSLFKGIVFDAPDMLTGTAGDCITIATNPGSPQTLTIREVIILRSGSGEDVGTLVSNLVNANVSYSIEHCTYEAHQGIYFELPGFANQLTSCKNNLAFTVQGAACQVISGEIGTTTDVVSSGNVLDNAKWNPASVDGYSDNLTFSSGRPGLNDVNANPGFVDVNRSIKTWDTSLGGPGTVAHAIAELNKLNDASGYNTEYSCTALLAYLRQGMKPTNLVLKSATDNVSPTFGWMGAVEGTEPRATAIGEFPKWPLRLGA